jgi:hypothetical protein
LIGLVALGLGFWAMFWPPRRHGDDPVDPTYFGGDAGADSGVDDSD